MRAWDGRGRGLVVYGGGRGSQEGERFSRQATAVADPRLASLQDCKANMPKAGRVMCINADASGNVYATGATGNGQGTINSGAGDAVVVRVSKTCEAGWW